MSFIILKKEKKERKRKIVQVFISSLQMIKLEKRSVVSHIIVQPCSNLTRARR